jgi:thiamine biosynthesis lipoprotein
MNPFLSILTLLLTLAVCLPGFAIQESDLGVPFEISGTTMGPIQYKVVIAHHPESVTPEQLQSKVQSTLDRVNQLMSTYLPDSDVSRFNASNSTEFQDVDAETARVVARAIEIGELTDGAFDITVGPAVNLWNFGPGKGEFELPSGDAIEAVKELIGSEKLEVRLDPPAIKKSVAELKIDLSAIAKGYAVDQVAKTLDDSGCRQFMVEVGGEVYARGERSAGGSWRIGVERPTEFGREIGSVAEISDRAMATSGDYRNFHEHAGNRYSHTIDPETCRPVRHGLATACVVTDDCMSADALATAIMVLGVERGRAVCDQVGAEYLIAQRDSDFGDDLTETVSDGFPLRRIESDPDSLDSNSIWPTFIGAAVVFGLVVLGMAVGSIFGNKPVQGSCGGLANMTNEDGETECGVCSKPVTDCVERTADA